MTKISQLSPASTPLTGSEQLLTLQGNDNAQTTVGQAQVLPSVDVGSATNAPAGTMAFGVGQVGGNKPVWSTGTQWAALPGTPFGRRARSMGDGFWMVGAGLTPIRSPARFLQMQTGYYWLSLDGFTWYIRQAGIGILSSSPLIKRGIEHISYANGCWLMSGQQDEGESSLITTSLNPFDTALWSITPPFGTNTIGAGTTPLAPSTYTSSTGFFTVPISAGSPQEILNPLPSAVEPDPTWPHVGEDGAISRPIRGMGTRGLVEVRINSKQINVTRASIADAEDPVLGQLPGLAIESVGVWTSHFIEARQINASGDFSPLGVTALYLLNPSDTPKAYRRQLGGNEVTSAGLTLRGLVWGPYKQTAVQFQQGSA